MLVDEFSFGDFGLPREGLTEWTRDGIVEVILINPSDGYSEFLHARFWETIGYHLIDVCIPPFGLSRVI